jgi:hypothetical protein
MKVLLPGGAVGPSTVFNLSLRWTQQGALDQMSLMKESEIPYGPLRDTEIQRVKLEVQKAVQLLEAARMKRKAMAFLDRGEFPLASDSLRASSVPLMGSANATGDADLQHEVQKMQSILSSIDERRDLAHSRKSIAYQSSNIQRGRREKARQ